MARITIDVQSLIAQIAALKLAFPELDDDAELLATTLEGETDLDEVLAALVDKQREAKSMAAAVASRIEDLRARKARYERQHDAFRDLMHKVMERADIRSRTLPEATLSISFRKPEPEVVDHEPLPDECVRLVRKPDMMTIREWCKNGNIPEGVRMTNGRDVLQVRTK